MEESSRPSVRHGWGRVRQAGPPPRQVNGSALGPGRGGFVAMRALNMRALRTGDHSSKA